MARGVTQGELFALPETALRGRMAIDSGRCDRCGAPGEAGDLGEELWLCAHGVRHCRPCFVCDPCERCRRRVETYYPALLCTAESVAEHGGAR